MLLKEPSQHLVRRPMSILDDGNAQTPPYRSFMIKPVGPASEELVSLQPGQSLEMSPAFGNGFPGPEQLASSPLLLVGGGFGIAPLGFLAKRLDEVNPTPNYRIVYGGRTSRDVELDVLDGVRGKTLPSTDDGSLGFSGTCVQLVRQLLDEAGREARRFIVLACGSHGMMRALYEATHGRVQATYVSLEEIMACGVGVCMGCVHPSRQGNVPICTHGPVFEADFVFGAEAGVSHVGV